MGQVTLNINGKNYRMACEDGQDDRLHQLAAYFNAQVEQLKPGFPRIQDDQLYMMAALVIADELFEARDELQAILRQMAGLRIREEPDEEERSTSARDIARVIGAATGRLQKLSDNLARSPATATRLAEETAEDLDEG